MSLETIVVGRSTPTGLPEIDTQETWGSLRRFMRLARVDESVAKYWTIVVHRPAHRFGHPNLNIEGCHGCLFETAVAR